MLLMLVMLSVLFFVRLQDSLIVLVIDILLDYGLRCALALLE
jgi:hypothetical protein